MGQYECLDVVLHGAVSLECTVPQLPVDRADGLRVVVHQAGGLSSDPSDAPEFTYGLVEQDGATCVEPNSNGSTSGGGSNDGGEDKGALDPGIIIAAIVIGGALILVGAVYVIFRGCGRGSARVLPGGMAIVRPRKIAVAARSAEASEQV